MEKNDRMDGVVSDEASDMELGRLTEADLQDLAGLYRQFWNEDSDLERMRAVFGRLKDNPRYIFLGARRRGRLVGSVMGVLCEELYGDCKPFMVAEDVVVDKEHRRSGVGTALMRELEKCAMAAECRTMALITEFYREDAAAFYESLGYRAKPYRGFKKRLPAISE
jgi:GNAT superfamily N-acetyltransferase